VSLRGDVVVLEGDTEPLRVIAGDSGAPVLNTSGDVVAAIESRRSD